MRSIAEVTTKSTAVSTQKEPIMCPYSGWNVEYSKRPPLRKNDAMPVAKYTESPVNVRMFR